MSFEFWFCLSITIISAFTSLGFSVAALRSATAEQRTANMYAGSRSVAIALASLIPLFNQSENWLLPIALVMVVVQAFDAVIGKLNHDPMKTYGPAFVAALNLIAFVLLLNN